MKVIKALLNDVKFLRNNEKVNLHIPKLTENYLLLIANNIMCSLVLNEYKIEHKMPKPC